MSTEDGTIARAAHFVGHDEDGKTLHFASSTTPPQDKRPTVIAMPPNKVVPIVFVPGIMGSNLKAKQAIKNRKDRTVVKAGDPVWRVDGTGSMLSWFTKGADEYQMRLRHDQVTVDGDGHIPTDGFLVFRRQHTPQAHLSVAQARQRGWGEVAAMFYLEFLDWLEHWLNSPSKDPTRTDADNPALTSLKQVHTGAHPLGTANQGVPTLSAQDLELLLNCDNPVHAFGYNWLQSNAASGQDLVNRINTIIQGYQAQGKDCQKVILVTHSMGGLVARAACQLHGAKDKVAGVFHGVMPTDGAAATYKRMVSGFGGEGGGVMGWASAKILGPTGDFTTPTLALNAGPLELLPNGRYNGGKPWFFVEDASGQKLALPKADPYKEIYTEAKHWWRPCNEQWLNPAGLSTGSDFKLYARAAMDAGGFHSDLRDKGDFHPITHAHYGQDDKHKAYATVRWMLDQVLSVEQQALLRRHDLKQAEMEIVLTADQVPGLGRVFASLSAPDAAGDGTVPALASAAAVKAGVQGGVLVQGTGYSHDNSYNPGKSEGPRAALHAVLHILKTTGVAA